MLKKITLAYRDKKDEYFGRYTVTMNPHIEFDPSAGCTIRDAARAAIDISKNYQLPVRMIFNHKKFDIIYNKSTVQDVVNSYLAQTR